MHVVLLLGAGPVCVHALVGLKADNGQHIAVISVSILPFRLASVSGYDNSSASLRPLALRNQSV